ncbi:GPW/gp25 family protein [Weissella sp. MSCH1]|uniref:GPW/gp25 family protein n=1 Tax=Weissella sp. MSCH1 TaxID=3383343 RepID=UPI003896BCAF
MIDFQMDENGDLVLINDLMTVSGTEQLKQSAAIILTTRTGEFTLVPEFGMTRSNLITRTLNTSYIQKDISDSLKTWNNQIDSVDNFGFSQNRETRELSVSFDLTVVNSDEVNTTEVSLNA